MSEVSDPIFVTIFFVFREKCSLRSIGREYGIPESTLRLKVIEEFNDERPIKKKPGRRTMLTPAEEHLLFNYIRDSDKRAMPVTRLNILDAVKEITSEDNANDYERDQYVPNSPLLGWWTGFKGRFPSIVYRTPETLGAARKNLSEILIKQWFSDVVSYFSNNRISDILKDPSRLFNLDETGFRICPIFGRVLCIKGQKNCFIEQSLPTYPYITLCR